MAQCLADLPLQLRQQKTAWHSTLLGQPALALPIGRTRKKLDQQSLDNGRKLGIAKCLANALPMDRTEGKPGPAQLGDLRTAFQCTVLGQPALLIGKTGEKQF